MGDGDLPTGSFGAVLRELAAAPDHAPRAPITPGTLVGEAFQIVRKLGSGGMGTVYLARDHRLGRDVAIKVHSAVSAEETMLREAQAMARVEHPNVVTVYEVGEHDGRVFVAMEYLAGGTFADWLAGGRRSWREIVAGFIAAGRGLAAAHAVGLVHRDFKPANVLFGSDGRICVSDFGLAGAAGDGELTAVGTPRYMAPEQKAGRPLDARADQFAFGIALRDATASGRVPAWVRGVVTRTTQPDPDRRWPSIEIALAQLERGLGRRRRAIVAGALVAVAAGALAAGLRLAPTGVPAACDLPDDLATTWNPGRRAEVAAALTQRTPALAAGLVATLDGYLTDWSAAYRDACQATRVRGTQSETLLDARMVCLDQRRAHFDATVDLLRAPGGLAGWRAVDLIAALDPVADCAEVERLGAMPAEPADPARRHQLAELRRVHAQAMTLEAAGRTDEAREALRALVPRVRAVGHPPATANALFDFALMASERDPDHAAALYDEALAVALAAGTDDVAAQTMSLLAIDLGNHGHHAEAARMIALAKALVARLPGDRDNATIVDMNLAAAYGAIGELDLARATGTQALALARTVFADQPLRIATGLLNLGAAAAKAGDLDTADGHFTEALAIAGTVVADHPIASKVHRNRGQVALQRRDPDGAELETRAALAIDQRLGDLGSLAASMDQLAYVLIARGKAADAEALLRQELASLEGQDIDRMTLAAAYTNLSGALTMQGKYREAALIDERALAIFEAVLAPSHERLVAARSNLGYNLRLAGDLARSADVHRQAVAAATAHLPPDHRFRVNADVELGQTLLALGDAQAAYPLFERAVAVLEENGRPANLAEARFALARTTLLTRRPRARALELARQADDVYAELPTGAGPRAEIAAWRKAIGAR